MTSPYLTGPGPDYDSGSGLGLEAASSPPGGMLPTGEGSTLLDADTVRHRTVASVLRLAGREMAGRVLSLAGNVVLARLLEPSMFGLFAIGSFIISLFSLIGELGLGAAFIRSRKEVTDRELNSLFTFQLALSSVLGLLVFLLAPLVSWVYGEPDVEWVVRALAITFVLTSLRSVPVVIAERQLSYGPVAISDLAGQTAYWVVASAAAFGGLKVWSLVLAVLVSGLTSTIALYLRTSWRPAFQFDWRSLRQSMRFGVLYQTQGVVHFVKDMMIPALGGVTYGGTAVGYAVWAQQVAAVPLQLTHLVSRVSYPALSHLQDDREQFARMVEVTLKWTARLTLPAFAVLAGLAPQIVLYVFGAKWLPAVPTLYLLIINMIMGIGTGVFVPALYSMGSAARALRIAAVWASLTWLAALGLYVAGVGFEALAVAYVVGTGIALAALILALRELGGIGLLKGVVAPLASGLVVATALYLAAPALVNNLAMLAVVAVVGGTLCLAINLWADRHTVLATLRNTMQGAKIRRA
ncbi:MAG TPA: oligosaccharide flippase family protein [Chloroflexia bacterium]|nr:oligosaccharide flippase family protein [Chloroflexia bacterium]